MCINDPELEEYRKILEELERKREELRQKLKEKLPELQEERNKLLEEIAELKKQLAEKQRQLKELDNRIRIVLGRGTGVKKGGKVYETLKEFIKEHGEVTRKEITEYLGGFTGYTGMMLKRLIEEGYVERVSPGVYRWIGEE